MKKLHIRFFSLLVVVAITQANAEDRKPNSRSPIRQNKIFGTSFSDKGKNPLVGAHGVFLGKVGRPPVGTTYGMDIADVSAEFAGNFDNYFAGKVVLGNFAERTTGTPTGYEFVREAYGKTMAVPVVSFKFGKFLADFGENNAIYTHAQPMVDRPLINTTVFGPYGFASVGAQMDIEIPTPWEFDISLAALSARLAFNSFAAPDDALVGVTRIRNKFNFDDSTSFQIGLQGAFGRNNTPADSKTLIFGVDVSVRHSTTKDNSGFGFAWFNEFILSQADLAGANTKRYGFYSNPMFRFAPKFWVGARFDYVNTEPTNVSILQESAMLAYVPSESTALRLQAGARQTTAIDANWLVQLEFNMTVGDLPGHAL